MTQKELDYVEDAVLHEKNLGCIIEQSMQSLQDKELVSFMQQQLKNHKALHKKLMTLLEGKTNE